MQTYEMAPSVLPVLLLVVLGANSFVFPDDANGKTPGLNQTEKPSCAGHLSVCLDEVPDYPDSTFIAESLEGSNLELLGDINSKMEDLAFRIGDVDARWKRETTICRSHEMVMYPKMAQNKQNIWKHVLNTETVIQGIGAEICEEDGEPGLAASEGTVCRQKYVYRRLLAMNDNGLTVADQFRLPSCCVCYVTPELLGSRFGSRTRINVTSKSTTAVSQAALRSRSDIINSSIHFGQSLSRRIRQPAYRPAPGTFFL